MKRGFLAELGSVNGLIVVLLVSFLLSFQLYSHYIRPPSLGSFTFMPSPREAYKMLIHGYFRLYLDTLSRSMVFLAPIAASISIALSIERGEERFFLLYTAYRRWVLYLYHSASVAFWLLAPSLLVYILAPLSVSSSCGVAMFSLGLLDYLYVVVAYALFYSSISVLASVVTGRAGFSILLGVLLEFLVSFLRLEALYLFVASLLVYAVGYYVYSRRDL